MHPTIRRRLKTGIALSAYIVLLAVLFALVSAAPATQTGPGTVVSETESVTVPSIPRPTWVDLRPQVITVHQAAPALSAQDLLANAQARLMNRIGATKLNLLTAFGPVRDGQVLTYINGKILWQDPVTLHGAAPANNGTVVIDGYGRRPESFVDGNRHYGGGGGSATTTTVVTGGGGTGDLTQANADGRYVNITGDTMNGALVIAYDGLGLNITGTASGSTIHAEQTLTSSGTLTVVGGATFRSTVAINNVTYSFPAHDGAGSGKVLKSDGAGNLSWADDITVGTGLSIATGDQRYVLKQGDTMSGTLVIDIRNGIQSSIGLKVINTLSGAALHADKDLTSSGTLTVNGNVRLKSALTILGTLTGNVLHAEKSLSSSGTLVFEGAASGSSLYVATSFDGAGLADCDTAGTSKLLWDATSKRFSCGTDTDTNTQFSNTGSLQTAFDNRYVNQSGDTMTGALSVRATLSGARLVISNNANISGSLLVLNSITTRGTLSGSRLVVSGHANISGALFVLNNITTRGTLSGANLTVSKSASISGSLLVKTGIASKGSVSGATIFGFGLGSCSGAGQKLSYNNITGVFGCASDVDTNTQFSNTGSLQLAFDSRYVNTGGDTMTGALSVRATLSGSRLVISNNANISGSLLVLNDITARGTLSGTKLTVSSSATISGALLVKTSITSKGSISGSTLLGFGLGSCNGASQKLLYNSSTNKFECGVVTAAGTFGTGNVITIGDARYVNASGDTMTGALSVRATLSGSRLVISGNANITGALLVQGNITSRGTISGSVLHASATLSSSGGLVFEGSASGSSLYIASSLQGAGLTDCDAASQTLNWDSSTGRFSCGTDLDTDTQFSNTGSLQTAFDARYVNTSGDTITGSLLVKGNLSGARLIISGNANVSGALLVLNNITTRGTLSGANLTVSSSASISGALLVKTSITSKGSLSGASFFGAGLGTCNGSTQKVIYDAATGKFGCGTDLNTGSSGSSFGTGNVITIGDARYVNTAGDTMTGSLSVRGTLSGSRLVVSGNANITGSLLVLNNITSRATISGSTLHASATLSSSGTVVWEGMASGSSLFLGSSFRGAGLTDCTGGNKLLWDATSGRFSCAADQSSGSGLDQNSADARYVRKSGDTMTGALVLNLTSGYIGLRVLNTASGAVFHAEQTLSSSGSLVFEGSASGSSLYIASSLQGAGLTDCDAATQTLNWDSSTGRFSCGTDLDTDTDTQFSNTGSLQTAFDARYVNTSGDTMTGALSVRGNLSGARLVISGNANITGSLLVLNGITTRGTLSGANLTVSSSASISGTLIVKTGITSKGSVSGSTILGFGLGSCTGASQKLLYNNATNKFECGTISAAGTFSTGNVLTLGDARYVKKSGDTMTGALVINITNGGLGTLGLKVINTFSGAVVHAEKTLTSSGTVVTNSGYLLSAARNQVIRVQTGNGTGKTLSILGASGTGATKGGDIFIEAGSSLVRTYGTAGGATSSGPLSPSTTLNNNGTGATAWTNPGNAVTSNDSYATASLIFNSPSQWLTASGFSFSIPSDATINGIVVEVEAKKTQQVQCLPAGAPRFRAVKLIKAGAIGGTNNAAATALSGNLGDEGDCGAPPNPPVDAYYSFGSSSDLWGQSWTYSDINDSKFGFATMFETPATAAGVQVDHMRITVHYTAGGTSGVAIATAGSTTINAGSGSSPLIIIGNKYSPTVRLVQSGGAVAIGKTTPSGNAKLDVLGTISGSRLVISNNAAVSGSLLSVGNIVTRATMSGTRLVVSSNANISGSLVVLNNITARGTLSGSRLVVSGHANISGTLLVLNNIVSRATVSGSNLYAAKSITGTHLYVAQTFGGAGLADCDTAGTSKLLWDSTTKRFSCGTDQTSTFGSGNVLTIGDRRYVNVSGDTMTGTLVIQNGNTHVATNAPLLNVRGTMSGRALIISGTGGMPAIYAPNASGSVGLFTRITSSNPMLIVGSQNGNNNYEGGQIRLLGSNDDTTYGSTSIDNYRGSFRILNRINGSEYAAVFVGSGGNVGIGSDAPRTKLEVQGTISGSALYVARSFSGAGLTDCDDSTFSKLLWDAATGRFLCGTDQGGSSGISQSTADSRYVNVSGDTMTGALSVRATLSGSRLTISNNANISGSLLVLNNIAARGTISGSTISGFGLGSCNGSTQKIVYNASTNKFECATDLNTGGGSSTGSVHMAKMTRDAAQTIPSGIATKVLFDAEAYDSGGIADSVTNDRFNIEHGGIYFIDAFAKSPGALDATEYWAVQIRINGSVVMDSSDYSAQANEDKSAHASDTYRLEAGDYVEMFIVHNEGGDVSTPTETQNKPRMSVVEVGSGGSSSGSVHIAKMTSAGGQSIPTSAPSTQITFDTENFDVGGIASTSTDRFTIARTGKYLITARASLKTNDTAPAILAVGIHKNGTIVYESRSAWPGTGYDANTEANTVLSLTAGDYLEMYVSQDSGVTKKTLSGSSNSPEMTVTELGVGGSGGGGESLFTDGGAITYLTATSDDVALGGSTGAAPFYFSAATGQLEATIFSGGTIHAKDLITSSGGLIIERAADADFLTVQDSTNNDSISMKAGVGDPNGVVSAQLGSLFIASDTGKWWRNNNGGTQWSEFTSGSGSLHMAKIRRDAAQAVASDHYQKIYFDTEEFDVGDIANVVAGSTGSGRITIKKAGKYLVNSFVALDDVPADTSVVNAIVKNGGNTVSNTQRWTGNNVNDDSYTATEVLDLVPGDTIETYVFHYASPSRSTFTAMGLRSTLSVVQVDGNALGGGNSPWTSISGLTYLNDTSHNVSIGGSTSAETKLEVVGTMSGSKLVITGTGGLVRIMTPAHQAFTNIANEADFAIYEGSGAVVQFFHNYASGLATLVLGGPDVNNMTKNGMVDFFQYRQVRGVGAYDLEINTKGSTGSAVERVVMTGNVGTGAVSFVNTRVGIGTRTPGGALQIIGGHGAAITGTGVTIDGGDTTTGSDNPRVELRGAGRTPYIDFATDLTTDWGARIIYDGGKLFMGTVFNQTNSRPTDLVVTGSGIGIGTSSPEAKLEVLGTISGSRLSISNNANISGALLVMNDITTRRGFSGNTLFINKNATFAGSGIVFSMSGSTVFNEQSRNVDFRIESDGDVNAFFVDASRDSIGVGKNDPKAKLDVLGTISGSRLSISNNANISGSLLVIRDIRTRGTLSGNTLFINKNATFAGSGIVFTASGGAVFNEQSNNVDFRIESDGNTNMFFVDASADSIGIGKNNPKATLDVLGTISGSMLRVYNGSTSTGAYISQRGNGTALDIISNGTTTDVFNLEARSLTTGVALDVYGSALTTGGLARFYSNSTSALTRNLVSIINNSSSATKTTPFRILQAASYTGAFIDMNGNAPALDIDSESTTQPGIRIDMPSNYASENPELLFGYNGTFDTNLFRAGPNRLATSGSLLMGSTAFTAVFTDTDADPTSTIGTDYTSEAKTSSGSPIPMFTAENPTDEYFYVGLPTKFSVVSFNLAKGGSQIVFQAQYYSNAGTWLELPFADGTSNLSQDGSVTFNPPVNWSANAGIAAFPFGNYYVRFHSIATNITRVPTLYSVAPIQQERLTVKSQAGDLRPLFMLNDQNNILVGTSTAALGDAVMTVSGAVIIAPGVTTARLDPKVALEVVGTLSGTRLMISGNATVSGSLVIKKTTYMLSGAIISGSLIPGSTNRHDLGTSARRWRDLYLSGGTLYMGTSSNQASIKYNTSASRFGIDANTDGTNELSILSTGNVGVGTPTPKAKLDVLGTISGSRLVLSGNANITGALIAVGNVVLGNASTDTITASGRFISSLLPLVTNTQSFGSNTLRWNTLFLSGAVNLGTSSTNGSITYDTTGTRINMDVNNDGTPEFRFSSAKSLDFAEASSDAPTAAGFARLFARPTTAGGNDAYTTYLVQAEHAGGTATNTAIGKTSNASHNGSCLAQSSGQAKFGTRSIQFNCSGYQYYRSTTADDKFTSSDFTVDMWVYEDANTSVKRFLIGETYTTNANQWAMELNASNKLQGQINTSTGKLITFADASDFPTGQWVHVALERSGSTFRLYRNGSVVATQGHSGNLRSTTTYLMLGAPYPYYTSGYANFTGYMDEIRISKKARYSGTFTPETDAYQLDTGGLYVRLGNGSVVKISGTGGAVDSSGDGAWTVNDDNTIYYQLANVGIGTDTPNASLHVQQDTAAGSGAFLVIQTASNGTGAVISATSTGGALLALNSREANARSAAIKFGLNDSYDVSLWRSAAGTLKTDGSMHVVGDLSGSYLYATNGMRWAIENSNAYAATASDENGLFIEQIGSSVATDTFRLQTSYKGNLSSYSQLFIDPTDGFGFISTGTGSYKVGIGTRTPDSELEVIGTISGVGLNVYGTTDLFSRQNGTGLTLVHGTVTLYNKSSTEGNVNSVQFRGRTNTGADYLTAAIGVEQHSRNGYAYGDLVFGATNQTGNLGELMRLTGSGDLYIGKASSSGEFTLQVTETSRTNGYAALFSHVGNSANNYGIQITNGTDDNSGTNRHINFTDGDGTGVGSITSTDGTVSYNAFTASHYGHATGSFIRGMLVSITGSSLPLYANQQSETVYGFDLTQRENDATVLGTYGSPFTLSPVVNGIDHYNFGLNDVHLVTAVGNGDMWVVDMGENLAVGDYLVSSSFPGYARKDSTSFDVSHIVGRIADPIDWGTVTDTVTVGGVTRKKALASVLFTQFDLAHPQALLTQSSISITGLGTFGSGILLNTAYANGNADIFVAKSNVGGTGNTVLRINASGAVFSDSTFNSQGADYAEWFKSTDSSLKAGEVVCIDILNTNAVKRCDRGADTNVIGIISTNPAFIGNAIRGADGMKGVSGYVLVGLIGQVPAKVTLEGGVIRPGDSLTAASLPGYARRAAAGEATVGVALEGYDGQADNVVNVLISRKNSSVTVETVNQKVLESIAAMNIGDEITRLVAGASQSLTGSIALTVQSQITALDIQSQIDASVIRRMSGSLISLADFGSGMTVLNTRIAVLESRVTALESTLSGAVLHGAAPRIFTGALVLSGSGTRIGALGFSGSTVQIGTLMSTGSLKILGNITVSGLATFFGNVEVQGQLVLSSKQAGFAVIPMTGTSVTVTFKEPLVATPLLTATPQGRVGSEWWVEHATLTGFTIRVATAVSHDVRFTWVATAVTDPVTTMGTGSVLPGQTIAFPVDNLGRPLSTDAVWNGCIRGYPPLGADGQPLSCARYHVDHVWEHPDLHMSFTYNPNHEPVVLLLPQGYVVTVIQAQSSSSSSVSSSSSSSSEATSSSGSSASGSDIVSGSGSVESSSSSSESSASSSESSTPASSSGSTVTGSGSEAGE